MSEETLRNADGSWNGVAAMAALAKLDPTEVRWTHARVKELKRLRYSNPEIIRIVNNEARYRPWEK